jgi:hypothetical protein
MLNVNRGIRALALGVVVGCMSVAPQIASAQGGPVKLEGPIVQVDPYTGVASPYMIANPCNGELVTITGRQTSFFYQRYNNDGLTQNVTVRVKNQGTGDVDGVSGIYNFHSEESFKFNDATVGAFEQTVLTKTMLIRQGSVAGTDDDFIFKTNLHITINANGVITAMPGNVIFECK